MTREAFVGTIAAVCVVVLAAVMFIMLPSPMPAYAQSSGAPQFPAETDSRNVDENTPWFGLIGNPVTATDPNNDRLTYSLANARKSYFTIDGPSGQLQVGGPLDYETISSYMVTVIATDPSGARDAIIVTVNVNNVEEDGKVSLTWTKPQVGVPITASLTDPDGGVSGTTWQWSSSTTRDSGYAPISMATSATYTPVAGDKDKYLQVTATYTDGEGSGSTKMAQVVSADVVRERPDPNGLPVFEVNTGGGYACSDPASGDVCLFVRRSSAAGSEIYYPARVTDPDDDEIRYSLGNTSDDEKFRIDSVTGDLFTKGTHQDKDDDPYSITITATDPSDGSASIVASIAPSGPKGAPVVTGPSEIEYPENGTWPVAMYSAVSLRSPTIGWIVSVEPGGGDGDSFDIDDDGFLIFRQPPDYEDPADQNRDNEYSFSITAYDSNPTDGKRPGRTIFPVKVIVVNVEESLEIGGPSTVEYAEDRTDAAAVYTAVRSSGRVRWTLSGDDGNKFSINSGGELTFRTNPTMKARLMRMRTVHTWLPSRRMTASPRQQKAWKSRSPTRTNRLLSPKRPPPAPFPKTLRLTGMWAARSRLRTQTGIR